MSLVLSPQLPPTPASLLPLSTKVRSRVPAVVYRIYCTAQHHTGESGLSPFIYYVY